MQINWSEVQRQKNRQSAKQVHTINENNKGFSQREDAINGWQGSGGQLLHRYLSMRCVATFGTPGASGTCVGK